LPVLASDALDVVLHVRADLANRQVAMLGLLLEKAERERLERERRGRIDA
jgi:hypothetical protein